MRILLVEPVLGGHHFNYLQLMLQSFVTKGHVCDVVIGHEYESRVDDLFALGLVDNVFVLPPLAGMCRFLEDRHWWFFSQLAWWLHLKVYLRQYSHEAELVWCPYFDSIIHAWGLLGSPMPKAIRVSGLFMYQFLGMHEMGIPTSGRFRLIKECLFKSFLRSKSLVSVSTILGPVVDYVRNSEIAGAQKVKYVPDPIRPIQLVDRLGACNALGIDPAFKHIVLFGAISERKGALELLGALKHLDWPAGLRVLFAGRVAPSVCEYIESHMQKEIQRGALRLINRFVSSEEEVALYSAADVMWVGYKNFYASSGVLLQSVASGVPVITTNQGMCGAFMKKYEGNGYVLDSLSAESIVSVVGCFLKNAVKVSEQGRLDVCAQHSIQAFEKGVIATLDV